jgi:hypothetical protein
VTKQLSMLERWAIDEELAAEKPREVGAPPRWQRDELDGYGPDEPRQPTIDDIEPVTE